MIVQSSLLSRFGCQTGKQALVYVPATEWDATKPDEKFTNVAVSRLTVLFICHLTLGRKIKR